MGQRRSPLPRGIPGLSPRGRGLERELRRLRMEVDVLKETMSLSEKDSRR
ncbi:hypothetical protein [Bifidobacterium tibiigranuli]|nr:hypothetical protein [Bifidobacterium tibiigranuli]MCI1713971.1 hypothetical protein [Bifidobacterium tibiigranuli]